MINLLPPLVKKDLQNQERMRLCIILAYSALGAALCAALALASLQFFMRNKLQEDRFPLDSAKTELAQKDATLQNIQQFNQQTLALFSFYQKRQTPTAVLDRLASLTPKSISLSAFSFVAPVVITVGDQQKQEPAKISVSGFASTRDALLEFRDSLQKNQMFRDVSFPPSNWVSPADITFSFTAALQ
ncbi:MAG: PilN domain-containing protein [Candidatus Wildermuthbacteria bacterium]|nr:PilN domain-containing protein [Candidatus Wildermuthbacteria bacterium]